MGAVLGQGTLGRAIDSQVVLDDAVMEHFSPGEEGKPRYGSVSMAPCMFQDNLANGSMGLLEAWVANHKVNFLVKRRGLQLNKDKSVCVIAGTKKQKQEASAKLEENPLKCGDFVTKEKEVEKWLGQYISGAGLADSVAKTVEAMEGKIKRSRSGDNNHSERLESHSGGRDGDCPAFLGGVLHPITPPWRRDLDRDVQGDGAEAQLSTAMVPPPGPPGGPWRPPAQPLLGLLLPGDGPEGGQGECDAGPALQEAGGGHPGRPGLH